VNNNFGIARVDRRAFAELDYAVSLRVLNRLILTFSGTFHPLFSKQLRRVRDFILDDNSKRQQRCTGGCFFHVEGFVNLSPQHAKFFSRQGARFLTFKQMMNPATTTIPSKVVSIFVSKLSSMTGGSWIYNSMGWKV
jgi:hypothetical protein